MSGLRHAHPFRLPSRVPELLRDSLLDGTGEVLVWAGTEPSAQLLEALPPQWRTPLPRHPDRRRETLAARRALRELIGRRAPGEIVKDTAGKPHLTTHPDLHVSITHSRGWGGALLARVPCGVDLQQRADKILRLRSKFERRGERAFVEAQTDEIAALHVLWGVKEALFKLWGEGGIDWHRHLVVHPFRYDAAGGECRGEIRIPGRRIGARCAYRWVGGQCLVCAIASASI